MWQQFADLHNSDDYALIAVAMDAEGIPAVRELYKNANVSFVALVDSQNALGQAWGFEVVPNGFLVDEAGTLKHKKVGGFEVRSPANVQAIEQFLAQDPVPFAVSSGLKPPTDAEQIASLNQRLAENSKDPDAHYQMGRILQRQGKASEALPWLQRSVELHSKRAGYWFALGSCRLTLGYKADALEALNRALHLEPSNYLIRKQRWVIQHPERFHPTIDWAWQREQMAKELEQEKRDGEGGEMHTKSLHAPSRT